VEGSKAGAHDDALESQAMAAVHRGDDRTARATLLDREPVVAKIEQLEAETKVIRAILAECDT
jgi:hypothetical protein